MAWEFQELLGPLWISLSIQVQGVLFRACQKNANSVALADLLVKEGVSCSTLLVSNFGLS